MKRLLPAVLCCIAVILGASASCEGGAAVVRVGDISYGAEQAQTALDELMAINEAAGVELSEAERAAAAENTVESFVIRGLAENRIRELGLDRLDKNTDYALQEQAQQTYEQAWQEVRAQYDAAELSDKQITMLLEAAGVSNESCYRELTLGYEMGLLLEHYGVSVELGDAELDEFYRENYVAPYEERYAENILLYESEVLFGEGDSLFVPKGYRRIQQILLPLPEEIQTELDAMNARAEELNQTAQAAYEEVAALGVAGGDIEPAREAYAAAKAELEQMKVEAGRLQAKVLPAVQDTVDEIFARLRAGEEFDAVAELYGKGAEDLPYHPDSESWPEEYAQALRTLKEIGDVSQPAVCADGVHIFCYAEDIPSGAVKLGEDQRAIVESAAQQSLSSRALTDLVSEWRDEYEIETDISQLNF